MKRMKKVTKWLAGVLCGVMMLSFAGCSDTTWVLQYGDDIITSGVYLGYLVQGYNDAIDLVTEEKANFWNSTVEESNAVDWVRDYALQYAKEDLAVRAKAVEYGIALDEDDESTLDSMVSYYWSSYQESYEENGIYETSFRTLLEASSLYEKVFTYYYGEDGIEPISDEELLNYLDSDYLKYKYIELSILDDDGNDLSDEEKAEVYTKAEGYVERLNAGEAIDTLMNEYDLEVGNITEDEVSDEETEYYYASVEDREDDDFTDQLFEQAEVDVPIIIETDDSYCVVLRAAMDATDVETYYDSILQNYKAEEFADIVDSWVSEMDITVNNAAVRRYTPKKLKIETE